MILCGLLSDLLARAINELVHISLVEKSTSFLSITNKNDQIMIELWLSAALKNWRVLSVSLLFF